MARRLLVAALLLAAVVILDPNGIATSARTSIASFFDDVPDRTVDVDPGGGRTFELGPGGGSGGGSVTVPLR